MKKSTKKFLKNFKFVRRIHQNLIGRYLQERKIGVNIDEITPLVGKKESSDKQEIRINILVPTLRKNMVFGGISTALKFFEALSECGEYEKRILTTDSEIQPEDVDMYKNAAIVPMGKEHKSDFQLTGCNDRTRAKLNVRKRDIFIATSWWSAYILNDLIRWQNEVYNTNNEMIYLIQDFEPGFYPWSSRYMLADSTYQNTVSTIAVYNTKILADFFKASGYKFTQEFYFEPVLNDSLAKHLHKANTTIRKKQIIVYGRPSVDRNCFEIIVGSLRKLLQINVEARDWEFVSLGEAHPPIELKFNKQLVSKGKVTLEEYAQIMCESSVGLSLMNSPHPSYPPLEMSTFGVKTITNTYANKNLDGFNENITSISNCSYENVAIELQKLINTYQTISLPSENIDYMGDNSVFEEVAYKIKSVL